jgi:hypothetical protein
MDIAEVSVNKSCCGIINSLLQSLDCLSSPISDLLELKDGSALVEIMECFENAFGCYTNRDTNYLYIKQWLTKQGVYIGRGRTVDELLKSGRSWHLVLLCYAITTVFLKNNDYLRKKFRSYNFNVKESDLISIVLFTKWKLCEEEIELKEIEILKQKNKLEVIQNESANIQLENNELHNEVVSLRARITELQKEAKKVEEEHKILVARLIAELSQEKFKTMNTTIEYNL